MDPITRFRARVLPRGTWCGEDLLDAHPARGGFESGERVVPIANEVARSCIVRKRFAELLGCPRRRGVGRDGDVHDAAPVMRQDHKHEHQSIRGGRDDEEIGCHDLAGVIREERAPGLRRWAPVTNHVLRHGGLTYINSELQEFAMDSRRAPQRVRFRH
jgi:hypothetical protein